MSVQDIQTLFKLVNDLRVEVSKFIGKSNSDHEHLSEGFDKHVKEWKGWRESTESQLNAIANAILQDQTRDTAEKEVETKIEKQEETRDNKWLMWRITIVAGAFTILSNLGQIFGFLAKIFSLLAG